MRYFLVLLISSLALQAQYFEEPNVGGFDFSTENVANKEAIATELASFVISKDRSKVDYMLAEKVIALAKKLDPKNEEVLIANASYKHSLEVVKSENYSNTKLEVILKDYIKLLAKSENKNDISVAVYLNDLMKTITGKDSDSTLAAKATKHNIKVKWNKIIVNYDAPKYSAAETVAVGKLGPVRKEVHPDYSSKAKSVLYRQAAINGLMVSSNAQGVNVGITSQVIGTVSPINGKTAFSFKRGVGGHMVQSLINAEKALKVRFPKLLDGNKIDVSFSNKFSEKDGDSAGTAITVMLFSLFEGIQIDKGVAITGTISPDWKVGIVGGVASKIRGAIKANCRYVGIPHSNNDAAQDLVILYGIENLWKIQVLSLSKLEQAIDLGRKDKSPQLKRALDLFSSTVKYMPRNMYFSNQNAKKKMVNNLNEVLRLCPHHLSARILSNVLSGKSFLRLSFITSVEEVQRLGSEVLSDPELPDAKVNEILATLKKYARRVDHRVAPFAQQIDTFLKGYMNLRRKAKTFNEKMKNGVQDRELYNEVKGLQTAVKLDRDELVRLAKKVDTDMKKYMEDMRKKMR